MAEKNRNSNPDENDVTEYQCHGDHWNAVLGNPENDFEKVLGKAVENGELVGSKNKNNLISFTEKDKNGEDNSVSVKMILSDNDGSAELISAYPCATHGAYVHVKIRKINEWENGLEATVEGELESGDIISFFDTDYLLHKDEYKIGKFCWFSLAGFAYTAEVLEKGAADFEFSGQEALDFNAKTGEEPEYDEEGNVKPVRFCLDNLVAYFPRECPDDAEFQSPLTGTKKTSKFFGTKLVSGYNITISRNESEESSEDINIPVIVAQENLEGKPREKKACRGVLWLHGHAVSDEEVCKFHKYKKWVLDHLNGLLSGELSEADFEKGQIPSDSDELNARMDNYDTWQSAFYDDDGRKDRVMFTYDNVPFNMLGTFKSFEFWDKDLIMTCVDFKKKFDKWPTAILTNEATYERWEEAVRSQLGDPHSENEDDSDEKIKEDELPEFLPDSNTRLDLSESDADEYWNNFDTDIPLDEITPEGVPIEFGEDFATPFFRLELLVDNNYEEGMFRLMFGEGPGTDEGEEIPDAERKTA